MFQNPGGCLFPQKAKNWLRPSSPASQHPILFPSTVTFSFLSFAFGSVRLHWDSSGLDCDRQYYYRMRACEAFYSSAAAAAAAAIVVALVIVAGARFWLWPQPYPGSAPLRPRPRLCRSPPEAPFPRPRCRRICR
jgi:hypothetical protein